MRRQSSDLWILNCLIVTQDSKRRTLRGHIRVVDGRIAKITASKPAKIPKGTEVMDAQGMAILPGFIQTHVHLCQTLFRNQADDLELLDWLKKRIWVMEAAHTEETLHTSALLGIHELLASGTTCLLDMGTVRHTDSIFEAVRESGIRASVGKCLMDDSRNNPARLREPTDRALAEAVTLFHRWNAAENDRIRVSFAPRFALSCTEGLLREVGALSQEHQALIHTHASENRKEVELVRSQTGFENIEYFHRLGLTSERLVLAHGVWLSAREKRILKETHSQITHCPSSNLKLASGIAPIPELLRLGIGVSLGADGAPCNNHLDMFHEMRLAALIHKPGSGPKCMRAQTVLDMATRNGAQALGWMGEIGSIEEGKKADLIALDLQQPENLMPQRNRGNTPSLEDLASTIVYSTSARHVRWTLVDGKILYRDGEVLTIQRKNLVEKARRAQLKIAARTA